MSFAKYNNSFSWKQRPQARIKRGLGLVPTKQCRLQSTLIVALGSKGHKQEQFGVSVWLQTKQCGLQSTLMVALGTKGHKQKQIGVLHKTMSFAKYNNSCPWKQMPHAITNRGLGLVSDKTMSLAKYNNGCPLKQRPQAKTNRGLSLVSGKTMSFAKYNNCCPWKQ